MVILQLSKIVKKTSPRRGGEEYIPRLLLLKPNTNMEKVTFNMLILNYLSPSISIQMNN